MMSPFLTKSHHDFKHIFIMQIYDCTVFNFVENTNDSTLVVLLLIFISKELNMSSKKLREYTRDYLS